MNLNRDQIIALAPDTASVKAAEKLLNPGKWPLLQFNEHAIWGECQGSGATPYQSRIDLNGPAFKCSCPSRKFPCKHGLALFLLFCDKQQAFTNTPAPPPWLTEWIESRNTKAQKKSEAPAKPVDEATRAKREEKRQNRVEQGLDELQRWLEDVARTGLGDLASKPYRYWENLSARLVDSQAGGLAFRVRQLGNLIMQSAPHLEITAQLADLALLVEAALRLEQLPAALQLDIRAQLGWTINQDEVLAQAGIEDQLWVWSHRVQQEDNLLRQDILVQGINSGRFARLLQFAHSSQRTTLLQGWVPGHAYQATARFFPGSHPLRALVSDPQRINEVAPPQHSHAISTMTNHYQQILQTQPWLGNWPYVLASVTPQFNQQQLWLHHDNHAIPTQLSQRECWQLLAISGGNPITVMGEWNGEYFKPLSAIDNGGLHPLHTTCLSEA